MPASTDYWINDRSGDPLLVITGEVRYALVGGGHCSTKPLRSIGEYEAEEKCRSYDAAHFSSY
jgi:hypothetical protein